MRSIRECVKQRGDYWQTLAPKAFHKTHIEDTSLSRKDNWMMKSSAARKLKLLRDLREGDE